MTIQWTQEKLRAKLDEMAATFAARDPNDPTLMYYQTEYITSKLWAKIKRRVLTRDNNTCASCGGHGIIVHHRSYAPEVLCGDADEMLATVCEVCQTHFHFHPNGSKRNESECDAALGTGLRDRAIPEPKIDLRRLLREKPAEWDRMTSMQRSLWSKRVILLTYEKRIARGETGFIAVVERLRAEGRI